MYLSEAAKSVVCIAILLVWGSWHLFRQIKIIREYMYVIENLLVYSFNCSKHWYILLAGKYAVNGEIYDQQVPGTCTT